MAKQRSQSKGRSQNQGKKKERKWYLAQMRGEKLQSVLQEPISDYEVDVEEEIADEVEQPEENDDETTSDRFEEDFNPNEDYDPFEFNPVSNTTRMTQKNNMVFLKQDGNRMKLYLNGHLRRSVVAYQRQHEMSNLEYNLGTNILSHSYMKPVFVMRLVNFLQEILDGFFSFELGDSDFLACLPLSTSKEIEFVTGIHQETIRKYLKNLSLQLEDGLLVSFNLITPEGKLPNKTLLRFRRRIGQGDHKQQFVNLVQSGKEFQFRNFFRSQLFYELMEKWNFTDKEVKQLSENRDFVNIVRYLRNG
ncbi:MAG: hypothetical protein U9N62_06465 [Thermotogota bacterium]|nr:hypothetical protein [Thermotogota bacterium]